MISRMGNNIRRLMFLATHLSLNPLNKLCCMLLLRLFERVVKGIGSPTSIGDSVFGGVVGLPAEF